MTIVPKQTTVLPKDEQHIINGKAWRTGRKTITTGAWVKLGDGNPRKTILIQAISSNASNIILAPSDTGYSNDPANDTCGLVLEPGTEIEPDFLEGLDVYARVELGGSDSRVAIGEAL